jgi:hypothetical protein
MAERFLDLGRGDRADILQSLAAQYPGSASPAGGAPGRDADAGAGG